MTTLREAAEAALEALEKGAVVSGICILRAALADGDNLSPTEPVAKVELMLTGGSAGLATRIVEIDDYLRERLRPGQLLYTAPPQRKPLTDKQKLDLATNWFAEDWAIEKALDLLDDYDYEIERAHGIKEAGCDHCRHPLYAAIKCRQCGRVTA